ncbi:MAG: NUDIX hydrolase [Planctomycetes bacterium]|nr:NUDIX hydrolase [Planctomycetota bacterium]
MTQRGPWKIVQSREVYADPWIRVQVDDVIRPDGNAGIHSIIQIKPGVCVVALDADHQVQLAEEFHYAVGRVTLEGVSGGIEPGEAPLDTARRELREELGIVAARWTGLGVVDPFTANVVSPTEIYLAEELTFGEPAHEGTERICRVTIPLGDAIRMISESKITHGPTCVALLRTWIERQASILGRGNA